MPEREAIILAAGLGTRLGELTQGMPKALVPVGGVPMLQQVAERLIGAGVQRLVINAHHHADQLEAFVRERNGFGVDTMVSREEEQPLETGGGIQQAATHLRSGAPFFIHNADILSEIPLGTLYDDHRATQALATVAVMERKASRALLFDDLGLCGRIDDRRGIDVRVRRPVGAVRRLAFAGIHVASPELPGLITEAGVFSILVPYLRLAAEGYRILPFRADAYPWADIGKPDQLEAARRRAEHSLPPAPVESDARCQGGGGDDA